MGDQIGSSLRERTRSAVRDQISQTALVMFDEQGFDETTVEQIVAAIGMSPRSFFRYFATKEEVVIGDTLVFGDLVRAHLAEHIGSLPLWDALRVAFDPIVARTEEDRDGTLRVTRVMMSTAVLRARNTEKHLAWISLLVPLVAEALAARAVVADAIVSDEDRDYQARAITFVAITCLDIALAEWVHRTGAVSHGRLLDEAFALLKPAVLNT